MSELWIIVLFILLAIFGLLCYSGLLEGVEISVGAPPIPGVTVAYKFAKGPYRNAGRIFGEVARLTPKLKPVGINFDNPNLVSRANRRYIVGVILSDGTFKLDPEIKKKMESAGFKVTEWPTVKTCVQATFPYMNIISIFIAVRKVYPKLSRFIVEQKLEAYPMLEVYEKNDKVHFLAPLDHQEEFFVPEAREKEDTGDHQNE